MVLGGDKRWFWEEIERALKKQVRDPIFRVIPVILPDGDHGLIDNFLEFRAWVDFGKSIEDDRAFHLLLSGTRGVPPGRYVLHRGQPRPTPNRRAGLLPQRRFRRARQGRRPSAGGHAEHLFDR